MIGLLQIAAAITPPHLGLAATVVALVAFLLGSLLCVLAVVLGAARSAHGESLDVMGLFLLHGSAPRRVQRTFIACAAALAVVGLLTATRAPFGFLAAMLPVGAAGVWGGAYGRFPGAGTSPTDDSAETGSD